MSLNTADPELCTTDNFTELPLAVPIVFVGNPCPCSHDNETQPPSLVAPAEGIRNRHAHTRLSTGRHSSRFQARVGRSSVHTDTV